MSSNSAHHDSKPGKFMIATVQPVIPASDAPDGAAAGAKEFTSAFEHAAVGIAIVAPDHRHLRVNPAFCAMLGYTAAEMLGLTIHDITHPEDLDEDLRQRAECLQGSKTTYRREKRFIHRDRWSVWVHLTCTLVRDDAGGALRFILLVQDITERKLAEQALRHSEQRLQDTQALLTMAAQVGRLGAWAWDAGARHVLWSAEVCAIHEVTPGTAPRIRQAVSHFVPAWRERMHAMLRACAVDGTPFDVEAPSVTAKGRRIWVRVIGEAEWDAHGRVRRVQGACQDITEAKHSAEEARRTAAQLSATLESLTDAFFTVDREWRFTYVNAEVERITKQGRAQLLGVPMWKAFPGMMDSAFVEPYRTAMYRNQVVQFEAHYAPMDAWAQVKVYPSPQGLAVYAKDVTDRVRAHHEILRLNAELEDRVDQRTAQLEAANRELQAFSYSIAHDLRAPLASIDGFSRVLQENLGAQLDERDRHYLTRIRAGVKKMAELTDGLLALANLSRTDMLDDRVDLAVLAHDVLSGCRERWPDRCVQADIAHSLPVRGDPRLLAQVMGNLVGNAWKFTSRRENARIEVGSRVEDGRTVFFVRDNGAGFDMAYASRMFEAFQRMHSASEFEGTGIGLALVHKIVTRHGGRIWGEGAPDQGATFHFTLGG